MQHPLLTVQPVLLQQDAVGHPDLPDIVQQAAPFQGLELAVVDAHHLADIDRDFLHPLAVPRRVLDRAYRRPAASAPIVWVNMSRISTKRADAMRVV